MRTPSEEDERYKHWQNQFEPSSALQSPGNVAPLLIANSFSVLPLSHLPSYLPYGHAYFRKNNRVEIRQLRGDHDPHQITTFGPNLSGGINYLNQFPGHNESFAHTQKRGHYRRNNPIEYPGRSGYHQGHRIDLHDTIPEPHNSNSTVANYDPQTGAYNTPLRMTLVRNLRTRGGQYREIALYSANPQQMKQKISGHWHPTDIPSGFIFEGLVGNASTVYYFPNEARAYHRWAGSQLALASQYVIRNTALYMSPASALEGNGSSVCLDGPTYYYRALNLLSLSPAALQHIRTGDWSSSCTFTGFEVPVFDTSLGYRFPRQGEPQPEWTGRPNVLNNIDAHQKLLRNYFALKLLEDAARYEASSINFRLTLVKLLCERFDYRTKATRWMKNIERFLEEIGSVDEILQAMEFAFDNEEKLTHAPIDSLNNILKKVIGSNRATVEDQLNACSLTTWYQLPATPLLFTSVTPDNSRLIQSSVVARESDIDLLIEASKKPNLIEFSLEGLHYYFDEEQWEEELRDYTDHVSYYNRPNFVSEILENLQKHSPNLRTLNLSGLRYNGSYMADMILSPLTTLLPNAFPHLESMDLSNNGFGDVYIWRLQLSLSNFPRLESVDLSFNRLSYHLTFENYARQHHIQISLDHQFFGEDSIDSDDYDERAGSYSSEDNEDDSGCSIGSYLDYEEEDSDSDTEQPRFLC